MAPKFRDPKTIDFTKAKSSILSAIDEFITKTSERLGIHKNHFLDWKNAIPGSIDYRVKRNLKRMSQVDVKEALDKFHDIYVIVPIDKAANNVSIKCKRLYANVLLKELGVLGNGSPTYQKINHSSKNEIIDKTAKDIKKKIDITITEDMKCLPTLYWLSKMHKEPIGARFIIASKKMHS